MKNKFILASALFFALTISPSAYAEDSVEDSPPSGTLPVPPISDTVPDLEEDPRQYPNIDILPTPSQEMIKEDHWTSVSSAPEGQVPAGQDEPETWAVVDENGNTLNVIVCDIDFCGSGWIPTEYNGSSPTKWARVVIQGSRDSETGNANGGHWGQYNFPSGIWTQDTEDGKTYKVPTAYGQEPVCILNCLVEEPEDVIDEPMDDPALENPLIDDAEEGVLSTKTLARNVFVNAKTNNVSLSFVNKVNKKTMIRFGKIWIIAKNNDKKKVWKFDVENNGNSLITLPIGYADWNISINYKLKNGRSISKRVVINN
jgi:hypothetical protein